MANPHYQDRSAAQPFCPRTGRRMKRRDRRDRYMIGSMTRKAAPPRSDRETRISPRCWSTMLRTIGRPSPVPLPSDLVVKNGSKIFSRASFGHPGPGVATPRGRIDRLEIAPRRPRVLDQIAREPEDALRAGADPPQLLEIGQLGALRLELADQ